MVWNQEHVAGVRIGDPMNGLRPFECRNCGGTRYSDRIADDDECRIEHRVANRDRPVVVRRAE
jgi:hypothetical protein